MANISITNVKSNDSESLSIQIISEEKMQNIRGGALSAGGGNIVYFVDANGEAWLGNIVISGEGLVWQTGSDGSDYTGA